MILDAPGGIQYWVGCLPSTMPHLTVTGNGNATPGYYLTGTFVDKAHWGDVGLPDDPEQLWNPGVVPHRCSESGRSKRRTASGHAYGGLGQRAWKNAVLTTSTTSTPVRRPSWTLLHRCPTRTSLSTDTSGNHWMISLASEHH